MQSDGVRQGGGVGGGGGALAISLFSRFFGIFLNNAGGVLVFIQSHTRGRRGVGDGPHDTVLVKQGWLEVGLFTILSSRPVRASVRLELRGVLVYTCVWYCSLCFFAAPLFGMRFGEQGSRFWRASFTWKIRSEGRRGTN